MTSLDKLLAYLDEGAKLRAEATPGPWHVTADFEYVVPPDSLGEDAPAICEGMEGRSNASFIVDARTRVEVQDTVIRYLVEALKASADYEYHMRDRRKDMTLNETIGMKAIYRAAHMLPGEEK